MTKPLLKFTSLSPEKQQGIMLTIELASRRQIRRQLTADQQKAMDQESREPSPMTARRRARRRRWRRFPVSTWKRR